MSKKREITKNIIRGILVVGSVAIASTSPSFIPRILPKILKYSSDKLKNRKTHKKFYDTFFSLKKRGLICFENRGGQIYISLTPEGKKLAGKYQVDDLKIKKPKKWDGQWRILIFDIKDKQKIKREALRGKIKELGLYQIQKSVWIFPYDFGKEINLLRSFFGLTKDEMKIILAAKIEEDEKAKVYFKLR